MRTDAPLERLVSDEVARQLEGMKREIDARLAALADRTVGNRVTLIVFSGDLDKVMAGFVIATGAAALGLEVSMFFTFWGLNALRKGRRLRGKDLMGRLFGLMSPKGPRGLSLSRMHFLGAGPAMLRKVMKDKQIEPLESLIEQARSGGVRLIACTMSMDAMGIEADELLDGVDLGGVATYLGDATDSKVTLFI